MKTIFKVWSKPGHTPLTGREGKYQDLLITKVIDCPIRHAKCHLETLVLNTEHGAQGSFYQPNNPNQNTRNSFVILSALIKKKEVKK